MKKVKVHKAFLIVMIFFIFIFSVFSISKTAYSYSNKIDSEIVTIDKKITELEQMKKGYEARATKHANTAQRLQFVEGQLQIAKKHWKLSEEYKEIAKKIQSEIDNLQAQKVKIYENSANQQAEKSS
jgi:cell division protein FtsL